MEEKLLNSMYEHYKCRLEKDGMSCPKFKFFKLWEQNKEEVFASAIVRTYLGDVDGKTVCQRFREDRERLGDIP